MSTSNPGAGRHKHLVGLGSFMVRRAKKWPKLRIPLLAVLAVPRLQGLFILLMEAIQGQWWQVFQDGKATPDYLVRAWQNAAQVRGTASLAKIDAKTDSVTRIEAAIKKAITAIDGFKFLSQPPPGRSDNKHNILIKPGVNWGFLGYPTVTSWQSVYTVIKLCFQEATARHAVVKVIVGDESGIEPLALGITTKDNLVQTRIFYATILAGLEEAAAREEAEPEKYAGAEQLLQKAVENMEIDFGSPDDDIVRMINMAGRAGVSVKTFDDMERRLLPVPGAQHFREGVQFPEIVAEEVTDIINIPKPPGRHLIMGNTGLSGALKNHVGLLAAEKRAPGLHGRSERYPVTQRGRPPDAHRKALEKRQAALDKNPGGKEARKLAMELLLLNREHAASPASHDKKRSLPHISFHEKIVELYAAVADKERFSVADMRQTVSSIGPDLGDTIEIGAVLAAKDPLTLDVLAGALLKRRYRETPNALEAAKPGGDTLLEYLVGKTWLQQGTPFELMSHAAANLYGYGPVDFEHIDLKRLEDSGFSADEIQDIMECVGFPD